MSYQLIHTSAACLLDGHSAGYGTVARSEQMPQALCKKLGALSVFREPRGGAPARGPQFSYHIIDHGGSSWHVLSCVQPAGADYSGRACHIAHHLVLSQEEVTEILTSDLRPTPAGISLALLKHGFWKSAWTGPPAYITGEPEPSPDDLPQAEAQPTWKKLTGHKANARAFYTHPYDRECLITVTPGTPVQDVLRLFHESDWLTHTRGWGASFTTAADDADTFTETLRMVSAPTSPLVQRAIRTGHPVLHIEQGLEIPLPPPEPPGSMPVTPQPAVSAHGMLRTVARSVTHYHYTEEPDWLLYDVRPPFRTKPLVVAGSCSALVAALLTAAVFLYDPAGSPTPESLANQTELEAETQPGVLQLTSLLAEPYNHDNAQELLRRLATIQERTPEDSLLMESASLILSSQQAGVQHAANVKRLCECARLLGVKDTELAVLYMREATYGLSMEDWQKQFSGQQLSNWLALKTAEPQLQDLMKLADLQAYAPSALPAPDTTVLATADTSEQASPEDEETVAQTGRVSLIPSTAVGGEELPAALESAIPQLPLSITTGTYVVSSFNEGGSLQPAKRLDLSPDGYRLYISPTDEAGVFSLTPEHKEGKSSQMPVVYFTVKGGRLQSVRTNDSEAVVSFPVPENEQFHTNVILVPSFGIPIPQGKGITLPPAAEAGLAITPDMLEIQFTATGNKQPRLVLRKKKTFPWELNRKEIETIRFSLSLPVLTGHNSVQEQHSNQVGYLWKDAEVTKETDSSTIFRCEVENRPDIPNCLEQSFERVANTPCCGEAPQRGQNLTLANLYYIVCALANDKLGRSERNALLQQYFQLFADRKNNKILNQIFAQDTALQLTFEEATKKSIKGVKARRSVSKMLETRATRDRIRTLVCEVLTRSLMAAYTQEQQRIAEEKERKVIFTLKHIDIGNHVELIWQFFPEYSKTK